MTREELDDKMKERICYYDKCPLHSEHNLKDKSKSNGPFTYCDGSLCDKYAFVKHEKKRI